MALLDWLSAWQDWGDHTALVGPQKRLSFRQLSEHILDRSRALRAEFPLADTFGIWTSDPLEFVVDFFACLCNGSTVVMYTGQKEAEWLNRLQMVRVDQVVRGPSVPHNPGSSLDPQKGGGWVLFSSGTSGAPKAMVHAWERHQSLYRLKKPSALVMLATLQLDHIGGLNTLFQALTGGNTLVFSEKPHVGSWVEAIQQNRVNILPTTPSMLQLLRLAGAWNQATLPSLKLVTYGTEPMPAALLNDLHRLYPGISYRQTFGTSETGIAKTKPSALDPLAFHLEIPQGEFQIRSGELWIRSRTQSQGYLERESGSFEYGWFGTGDLVHQLEDGSIKILGRRTRTINVGGEKVQPEEIESLLMEFPEVRDCRIYGEAFGLLGQRVVAEVVLQNPEGKSSFNSMDFRKRLRAHLEAFKIPSKWVAVEAIPIGERLKRGN